MVEHMYDADHLLLAIKLPVFSERCWLVVSFVSFSQCLLRLADKLTFLGGFKPPDSAWLIAGCIAGIEEISHL